MGPEYMSYEGVLVALQLEEDELDEMIQDGKLHAIPDGGRLWFLRAQVDSLKEDREGMQTINWEKEEAPDHFGLGKVREKEPTPPPPPRTRNDPPAPENRVDPI